jgi:hypothetical protein
MTLHPFLKPAPLIVIVMLSFFFGFLADHGWESYRTHRLITSDEATMEALSKIIALPEEIPSIATVTDKEKLADQPFFQKAENGDKVIMYSQNRRAYLFRPSEQKIIDMTVIAVDSGTSGSLPVFQTNSQ